MSDDAESRFDIRELADRTGLSVRTIRYYLAQGLIPSPSTRGRGAIYAEEHLLRLRLVQRLSEGHVPLAEIRERLAALSTEEVRGLLEQVEARQARLEQSASPRDHLATLLEEDGITYRSQGALFAPVGSGELGLARSRVRRRLFRSRPAAGAGELWQRWQLAPGVELHVNEPALTRHRELIERLLRAAQQDQTEGED